MELEMNVTIIHQLCRDHLKSSIETSAGHDFCALHQPHPCQNRHGIM